MRRCQLHHCRDEARPRSFARHAPLARFAAPGKQLLRRQPMPARNHRHRCSRLQRLLNDPRLVIHRPTTTPADTGDHLDAPDKPIRLKRRVKSRHKPIPILTPGSAPSHLAITIKRRPQNIAYPESTGSAIVLPPRVQGGHRRATGRVVGRHRHRWRYPEDWQRKDPLARCRCP
jgi:hypothetical protein